MGPRKTNNYTAEQLEAAVGAVKNGIPFKTAAKQYGIPRATLQFRCSDKFSKATHGPAPVLCKEEEDTIVRWIFESARKGFPRRKEDIVNSISGFYGANNYYHTIMNILRVLAPILFAVDLRKRCCWSDYPDC